MSDRYQNFAQLEASESRRGAFRTVVRTAPSDWIVVAPHGGGIEPGTSEIARAVAGAEHSLYLFEGTKYSRNSALHITSTHFDDPALLLLLQRARRVVTIHGCTGEEHAIVVGGRDDDSADHILGALRRSGVEAWRERGVSLRGTDPQNICNRNQTGIGLQLEFCEGLRRAMFESLTRSGRSRTTSLFATIIEAVRSSL